MAFSGIYTYPFLANYVSSKKLGDFLEALFYKETWLDNRGVHTVSERIFHAGENSRVFGSTDLILA
jgi:hypothetical protein